MRQIEPLAPLGVRNAEKVERCKKGLHHWRDIAIDCDVGGVSKADQERFWRTLLEDKLVDERKVMGRSHNPYKFAAAELYRWLTNTEPTNSPIVLSTLAKSMNLGAQFLRTKIGRIRHYNRDLPGGGVIALLAGSKYPFIVRSVEPEGRNY